MSQIEDLFAKVESLQKHLIAIATGGDTSVVDYQELRKELLNEPMIRSMLPHFLSTCRDSGQFWQYIKHKYSTYHERRNYLWGEFQGVLTFLEENTNNPSTQQIEEILTNVNASTIHYAWRTALHRKVNDPEGAITSARTLLESTCKYILDNQNISYTDKEDLPKLYRMVAESMNLAPSQHLEPTFKQILGGCQAVVEGLGTLRNKLGDAHGKGIVFVKPSGRHSELAVNLAGTLSSFLLATYEERGKKASI